MNEKITISLDPSNYIDSIKLKCIDFMNSVGQYIELNQRDEDKIKDLKDKWEHLVKIGGDSWVYNVYPDVNEFIEKELHEHSVPDKQPNCIICK